MTTAILHSQRGLSNLQFASPTIAPSLPIPAPHASSFGPIGRIRLIRLIPPNGSPEPRTTTLPCALRTMSAIIVSTTKPE